MTTKVCELLALLAKVSFFSVSFIPLLEYDGRERCGMVQCHQDSGDTYKKEMKTWAAGVGWNVREKGVMMKTVTYSNPKVASYCI